MKRCQPRFFRKKYEMTCTGLSHIRFGYRFLKVGADGGAYVVSKVALTRWGVIKLSAADLLTLCSSKVPPELPSAQLLVVGMTLRHCLETFNS